MSYDPPRLLQTNDPELAELLPGLRQARGQGPNAEQLARLRANVAQRTSTAPDPDDGGASASTSPAPAAGGGLGGAPGKLLKLVTTCVLLGGALLLGLRAMPGRVPAARSHAPAPAVAANPIAAPAAQPPVRPEPRPPAALPGLEAPAAPRPAPQQAHAHARPAAHSGSARRAPPPASSSAPDAPDLAGELALLKRARAHVRSSPAQALALTDEHRARFGAGTLAEEREVIAIEALLVQGDRSAAQARARAFFSAYRGSAHARRVRTLLAQ